MKIKTYENLRKLAIIDAKRRLQGIMRKIPEWNIIDRVHKDGVIEKVFRYGPTISTITTLSLNEYAHIREIKYIVWRFEISKEEMDIALSEDKDGTKGQMDFD